MFGIKQQKNISDSAAARPVDKIRQLQDETDRLQKKLDEARAHSYDREKFIRECDGLFASILTKSDEQLRCGLRFNVQKKEGAQWAVVTGYCCLGGCDIGVYTFAAERDALLYAALLEAVGFRPSHNTACPACYTEYMKDCL